MNTVLVKHVIKVWKLKLRQPLASVNGAMSRNSFNPVGSNACRIGDGVGARHQRETSVFNPGGNSGFPRIMGPG